MNGVLCGSAEHRLRPRRRTNAARDVIKVCVELVVENRLPTLTCKKKKKNAIYVDTRRVHGGLDGGKLWGTITPDTVILVLHLRNN